MAEAGASHSAAWEGEALSVEEEQLEEDLVFALIGPGECAIKIEMGKFLI